MVLHALLTVILFQGTAAANAEGHYSVRNEAGRAFTCGLRREDRSVIDRFVLRAGEEWQQTSSRNGVRTLLCDAHKITPRYPMRSGVRYALVIDSYTGRVVLRPLGPLQ